MNNLIVVLNVAVVLGMIISAILASELENLLSAAIALSVTGIFAAAEFPADLILLSRSVLVPLETFCQSLSEDLSN